MLVTNSHAPRVYTRDSRHHNSSNHSASNTSATPPLVLSLSQIQGGGGLLILNSNSQASNNATHKSLMTPVSVASFVCSTNNVRSIKNENHAKMTPLILKQEAMDTSNTCSGGNLQNLTNGKIVNQRETKMEVSNDNLRQSMFDGITYSRQERSMSQQSEVVMTSAPSTPSKQMDTSQGDEFKHQNFGDTVVLLGK